jgi:hypothetical protein
MKTKTLTLAIALAAIVSTAEAQTVVTTSPAQTTTFTGTVSQIDPSAQTIILQSPGSATAPVTYSLTPQTVIVDASGNTVPLESIRNSQLRIEYETNGGRTTVRRVITTSVGATPPPVVIGH